VPYRCPGGRNRKPRRCAEDIDNGYAVDRVFAETERQTERLLAFLRLLVLFVLAFVFWFVDGWEQGQATMVPLAGLTATTLGGLAIAGSRLFRPWVPWVLATLDVVFLIHCLAMFAIATGQPLQLALETPAASVIFVFLATAAIRHRPFLVLYSGGLFVLGWVVVWMLAPPGGLPLTQTLTTDLARLAVVGLVAFALFVAVNRARSTLVKSITEARLRANLSRYFSPQVVDRLAHAGHAARAFRSQKAAILFADLRGFTALTEKMPPEDVAAFLNEYRRRIADPIISTRGMIDKFIGDGVMAVFGVPQPGPDDARDAMLAGVGAVSAIAGWSQERTAQGLPPVRIGVGIHYGDVIAGALGDEHRLEYTVIGDAVNTAARIEEEAASLGAPLLISAEVVAAAPGMDGELQLTALAPCFLRGRSRAVQLYRLKSEAKAAMPVEGEDPTTLESRSPSSRHRTAPTDDQ
jgi:adenylate cyclase